ncbi:anaerobic glycerol-3-phosphate dehydrogenase subunit A [uncultured Endozoicomonas sp.]|uniref:anaerobic glycerol-3-phosphate dehydrogenase subunit A n=1 Tax=uncultured Endozoicomonas sp. TaxID=432652 RepID=UPI0026066866|nr:anaerobic glycerol-3-phosphate dehydrogenase subunit A [uncultured Endozoicomonas sp.]
MRQLETDVVIIGGGATGAGVLRDCALRGMRAILVEKDDIANGTTGRNHGLLHSGARYAVTDQHSASECISENKILKRIAGHCIEETGGLFITLPEDDLSFQSQFIESCTTAGIQADALTPAEALRIEPNVNPALLGAVRVPDGTVDPFRLTASNILDAEEHGGRLLNYTRVTGLIINNGRACGVHCVNLRTGEPIDIHALQVVNAAGIWGQQITEYGDLSLRMFPAKGSLLIMDYRVNSLVINRCRKPADADILVPGDTISLIGTTSEKIPYSDIENIRVTPEEVETLLSEGEKLCPAMANTRILRAYCGVRPLVALGNDDSGRNISRGIVLLDHGDTDGLPGLITITGGKLMTYRLMAEMATDAVAKNLGNTNACETAERHLPGANGKNTDIHAPQVSIPVSGSAKYRHGERAARFLADDKKKNVVICECEMVTRGEIEYAVNNLNAMDLVDLRRRTRIGMGPCQGKMCACRAAGIVSEMTNDDNGDNALKSVSEFMQERWKGVRPILWGDAMREADLSYWLYNNLLGCDQLQAQPTGLTVEVL